MEAAELTHGMIVNSARLMPVHRFLRSYSSQVWLASLVRHLVVLVYREVLHSVSLLREHKVAVV